MLVILSGVAGAGKDTIKTNDKKTHQLFANLEESTIPYHKENFAKFASKYEK